MKYGYYYRRRKTLIFKIICIFLAAFIGFLLTDAKFRPAVYELAAVEAKAVAVKTIHTAVEQILAKSSFAYSDIVGISRNNSGSITGITTDIVKLNLFKSRITNAVDKELTAKEKVKISVPLGSASGITFLSGWGPDVKVKIAVLSSTQSDFENRFESAGINQTQHSVILNLSTQIIMIMSGRRITTNVNTSFCIAQTVIVGTVPNVMVE